MKKLIVPVILMTLVSCAGHTNDIDKKKAELDKLRSEQNNLSKKISSLEKEIAAAGGDSAKAAKFVTVAPVIPAAFNHYIEIQGHIEGDENVWVSAKSSGVISRVLVKEGDNVQKGQVLAEMDNQIVLQSIDELKTSLAFAENVYEKQKKLWDQKIGTEIQFLTAKNNKESLEHKLSSLKEQLDMTRIKSPINGTVDGVDVKIGQAVMPGAPTFRVVNFSKLKVAADVSEAYASKVKIGNPVKISFPDLDKDLDTKLDFVSRVINVTNRTFSVEVGLVNPTQEMKPNMVAVMKINDYNAPSTVVVPVNVIQNSEDGQYLFVAADNKGRKVAEKRKVTVGLTYNGSTEVKSGLREGDRVIVQGYNDISTGQAITF